MTRTVTRTSHPRWLVAARRLRTLIGPVHRSVRERWLADAHGYRNKSKALAQLLASVDGGWSKIPVMRQVVALRRLSGYSLCRLFFHMDCQACTAVLPGQDGFAVCILRQVQKWSRLE